MAYNVTLPSIPRRFDLRDATDATDRKEEVLEQNAVLVSQMLKDIVIDPVDQTQYDANTMARPAYVLTGGGITAYEAAMAAALVAAQEVVKQLKLASQQV